MRGRITKRNVDALQPGEVLWDVEIKGFGARRLRSGLVTYGLKYRDKANDQRWGPLGTERSISVARAREKAKIEVGKIADGVDPWPDRKKRLRGAGIATLRFDKIAEVFIARHAKKHTRSWPETERILDIYVKPAWGRRAITEISRADVTALLDAIEDGKFRTEDGRLLGGPVQADRVLAVVRKLFNWYAARADDFNPPVIKGMARTKPSERARSRVLTDDEIRAIWPVCGDLGPFGAIVRLLLLTGQRRDEVAKLRRSEIDADGVWTIPAERYKTGRPHILALSAAARDVIDAQPVVDKSDYVFTTTGKTAFSGFSKAKRRLDEKVLEAMRETVGEAGGNPDAIKPLDGWVLHDVRRTSRTLLARAGVREDVAERTIGHVVGGVKGVYDRHHYFDEKRAALEALATLIERIINPPAEGVVVELRPEGAEAAAQ